MLKGQHDLLLADGRFGAWRCWLSPAGAFGALVGVDDGHVGGANASG